MFNDPLHHTKVVHHLHKGNEEDDGTQNASEEPALVDGVLIEEENGTDSGFLQEIGGEESEPPEYAETRIGLENEESDSLLEKETDDDRLPANGFNCRSYITSDHSDGNRRLEGPTTGPRIGCGKLTRSKTGRQQDREQKWHDLRMWFPVTETLEL